MSDKDKLLNNIDKVHTTKLGVDRIKKNLKITKSDVVNYCINLIKNSNCAVTRRGKNYYCQIEDKIITINAYSYTIITAHFNY